MNSIPHRIFLLEAVKVTVFCLAITGIFRWFGASNDFLLVILNMAVMSNASTFSPERKKFHHLILASFVIVISTVSGGLLGYYVPTIAQICTIIYAGLAFFLSKTKAMTTIFVTGSVLFLIFTALPFDLNRGMLYLLFGIVVILLFVGFHLLFNTASTTIEEKKSEEKLITACIAIFSLAGAWIISYYLNAYTSFSHLYWIGLTALVVIQGSQQKKIKTAFIRIVINTIGALIIVFLFSYIIPATFWINFVLLIIFLFMIFALGYSYAWRTLFIELFVLAFTHLLGSYQNMVAFERVILTVIGGALVIVFTTISYTFFKLIKT